MIQNLRTGVLFGNPMPHVHSIHAYFPSVVQTAGGRLLAAYVLGEAFEAANLRVHLAESVDGGEYWTPLPSPAPLDDRADTSEAGRLSQAPDGTLVLLLARHDRAAHPGSGLANPDNLGFVPMRFLTVRSSDGGKSWTQPQPIDPPIVGPEFELCAPITPLSDGRWLLPTSTWRNWQGELPNGDRMGAFVSDDQGRTWHRWMNVMSQPTGRMRYWEAKILERSAGELLAIAWVYDEVAGKDLPNHYALSHDGGATWTAPATTGLNGQTMASLILDDGRVLSAYRRLDRPGLWLNLSRLEGDQWINEAEYALWGHQPPADADASMVQRFATLKFGAPHLSRLADGTIFLTFWCYEECVGIIRWFAFRTN